MILFDAHIDRDLGTLGAGSLTPRRFRQVVRHARSCHRCAALYDRSIRVLRQLENRSPFVPAQVELDAIAALNLRPAMGRAVEAPRTWGAGLVALALVAAAAVVLVVRPAADDDELGVRGGPTGAPVALRVFCGGAGQPLTELREGEACAVGQSLAFAAGAAPTHPWLAVRVGGSAVEAASASEGVTAAPGAEQPVALTVRLERPGEVEVVAAFAPDVAVAAVAAAQGEGPAGTVVLRRTVRVRP